MRKYIIWFWVLVLGGLFGVFMVFFLAERGVFGKMPTVEDLQNPKSDLASEIYSSDGKILGKYFYKNRTNAHYQELSPHLTDALVATEDERYFEHPGIDFRGTTRAVVYLGSKGGASTITQQLAKMLFTEKRSTSFVKRVIQKIQEWIIAAKLERHYTKQEIIAMYYNRFDFINNAVGIKSAASIYFNTIPDSLNLPQSAMLVGMAKNPSLFNPKRWPDTTMHRRNVVFGQMVRNQMLSEAEFDSLKALPLGLDIQSVDHNLGVAPYFRETLRGKLKEILLAKKEDSDEYVYAKENGDPYNIYKDGLRIYTTINYKMQQYGEYAVTRYLKEYLQEEFSESLQKRDNFPFASLTDDQVERIMATARKRTQRYRIMTGRECHHCHRRGDYVSKETIAGTEYWVCKAEECGEDKKLRVLPEDSIEIVFDTPTRMNVFSWQGNIDTMMSPNDSIRYYKSFLQSGLMSLDPNTGHIKAWVGGINHRYFEYDHVQLAKRQVGSTFKPFVYALALESGIPACHTVPNIEYTFKKGEYGLQKDWTPSSQGDNTKGMEVTLKYALANSLNPITAWAMKQYTPQAAADYARKCGITSPLDPVPALCLGVADISLYEMVHAYSTFANKGNRIDPVYLLRIEDNSGTIIYESEPSFKSVMSEEMAYKMLDLMKGVTEGELGPDGKKIGTAMRMHYDNPRRGYDNIPWNVEVAGKTGTTQGNSDGWFMGVVPNLVTGVWVGADDRSVRFLYTSQGQGANTALPIWCYYMHKVWNDKSLNVEQEQRFERPESLKNVNFDCDNQSKSKDPFGGQGRIDAGDVFGGE